MSILSNSYPMYDRFRPHLVSSDTCRIEPLIYAYKANALTTRPTVNLKYVDKSGEVSRQRDISPDLSTYFKFTVGLVVKASALCYKHRSPVRPYICLTRPNEVETDHILDMNLIVDICVVHYACTLSINFFLSIFSVNGWLETSKPNLNETIKIFFFRKTYSLPWSWFM